ncbi:hypothetical protein PENTCL1PPCAC_6102, partial [Pristionchus entomophagus]
SLTINFINAFITSLLWAGAFANKKNCLPIYATLELIYTLGVSIWVLRQLRSELLFGTLPAFLIIYTVLKPYYEYLDGKDKRSKRLICGEEKLTNQQE